jgi:hypothetical protein
LLAGGCYIVRGPRNAGELVMESGRTVLLELHRESVPNRLQGELLEVRDSTLIVRAHEVLAVPFSTVRKLSIDGRIPRMDRTSELLYGSGRPGDYLKDLSRYPFGAPPEVMQQILQTYGQQEPTRIVR